MRQIASRSQKFRATSASLPAPIGGWNARDALGDMDPRDAVILTNLFPATSDVILRYGYTQYATGISGQVQTVMAYAGAATDKLFAIASGSVYDITAGGAVGAASVTGLTNSKFQYQNLTTTGGSYIVMVNGADKQQVFDGTNWHKDGDGSPYDISNVDSVNLIQLNVFKTRLWYIQKNTLWVWYLPVDSIGGAAVKLDLSSVFQRGGYLVDMATWTIDAGYGVDDYAVWISSKGEVAIYRLTDPTTPTGIALIGLYWIGSPVGTRCSVKYKGDCLIISQDGVTPLSSALQSSRLNPRVQLTDKIQWAMSSAVTAYGGNFGWQLMPYPKQNMLLLNVPVQVGNMQQQYVMNTITGQWCNFTGWNANCWEMYEDDIYFGSNGYVGKAWNTLSDNGTAIQADGLQAFNYFGRSAQLKRFTMSRPILQTNGTPSILNSINIDFDTSNPTSPLAFSTTSYAVWDSSTWDSGIWGSDLVVTKAWQGVTGVGYCGGVRLNISSSGIQVQWVSTDVVFEPGAIL